MGMMLHRHKGEESVVTDAPSPAREETKVTPPVVRKPRKVKEEAPARDEKE